MLLAGAGCVFTGFILYISGVSGRTKSICALKGSSVDLLCSTEDPTSSNKWFTVHWSGYYRYLNEISVDGHRVTSNMSDKSQPTLTIKNLTERDADRYCCSKNTDSTQACLQSEISLQVADLQVKVIPATEEQTVTLMCSSSCPLTENPAAYIWYKNRELLYQDWSPWYQELVSSEEAVRYSCAVKGYEELRAPEVSVDSVTPTCINVTYAKGRMCEQTSVDESCSITYPTEIRLQRTSPTILTCATSCPLTDPQTVYRWYWNREVFSYDQRQISVSSSVGSLSCAVKGLKDLLSPEVCVEDENCWSVNYASRRICALQGSSVSISSKYSHPYYQQPQSKQWYKIKRNGEEAGEELITAVDRVQYHEDRKKHHTLTITQLKKKDSAEYMFRLHTPTAGKQSDPPGVTLVVTDLRVRLIPAAVTEGQRVALTCITSCPLSVSTTYTWYLNGRPLTLPQGQNKRLVLDPVSTQHAGNYSCAVTTENRKSSEKTLTVQSIRKEHGSAAAAGASAALLVIIPLIGVVVFFWIRRRRNSSQSLTPEATENTEELNPGPVYENISAQPTEEDDLHYSTVHFSKTQTDPLDSTIRPHQPEKKDHATYTAVSFRPNMTPE